MGRTRAEDWLNGGLIILRTAGESALTIERLCRVLKRTKGAFYHHFRDVEAYQEALLAFWESNQTTVPIERANAAEPRHRRRALHAAVHALDQKLDLAVRAWGLRSSRARAFVARVDRRRIGYLNELADVRIEPRLRRSLAHLEYVGFLGVQQLRGELTAAAARDLEQVLHAAMAALVRVRMSYRPRTIRRRSRS